MRLPVLLALLLALPALGGCVALESVALRTVYTRAQLPDANVRRDLAYVEGPEADPDKHRLDLFLPHADSVRARPFPVVVYVHGGGWTEGDRGLTFGGQDIYGNIGRFLAARGIGAAVISYRLQPGARWTDQVDDVARAVAFVHREIGAYGGNPRGIVLMGHSAGAQLAAHAALNRAALEARGVPPEAVCGAVSVSGAGLDLTDRRTFELRRNFDYFARRFGPPGGPPGGGTWPEMPPPAPYPWQREASPATYARPDAPPYLILHAEGEGPQFARQAEVFAAALREAGARAEQVVQPGSSHTRILAALSRPDRVAGDAVLRFVRSLSCA